MADSTKDKIKYGLLKGIDASGFTVLDPVVRLAFGEEPQKQLRDIGRYMVVPIIFIGFCVLVWSIAAPRHKTKSGEVPGPAKVLNSYADNSRFDERENEKQSDFNLEGAERAAKLKEVEKQLIAYQKEADELSELAQKTEIEGQGEVNAQIAPIKTKTEALTAKYKAAQTNRKADLAALAEKVALNEVSPAALVEAIRADSDASDLEKDEISELKTEMEEIRSNPPAKIQKARLASNKVADEVQHYKKRVDYLTRSNRSVKLELAEAKAKDSEEKISAATDGAAALSAGKSTFRAIESIERTEVQKYPRAATIFWQAKRSIFTVILGFLMACVVAIPIGMMCGLNRVFMACMTPIISIFRPVSPVVWLLIFQIVIGAFFPKPDEHGLFMFFNASWNPLEFLQVNPAMVFSAFTVAMCAMWPALVNTALGVSSVDKDHMNVAKVLRLGFWTRLFKIVIPSSLPLMFAGLRISLGVGWMVLIAAEALSSSDGLGKFVWDEYQNGSSQSFANIILACFIVGIIGFFLDRIMIILQKLVTFDDGSATV
ncbi:MAG: ABC transporter permease subunit [Luteolibacter sp.]